MKGTKTDCGVEVEAKYLGGKDELEVISSWYSSAGFDLQRKQPIHRMHIYFDDSDKLRKAGCRFRCIIAPGEWCRYDFKVDDESGNDETIEASLKVDEPIPPAEVVDQLAASLPQRAVRELLSNVRDSLKVIINLSGKHTKARVAKDSLDLEISWDVLASVDTGKSISEIEIELVSGERADFDQVILNMEQALQLTRIKGSKIERITAL